MIKDTTYKRLRAAALLTGVAALSICMTIAVPKARNKIRRHFNKAAIQERINFNGALLKMFHAPSRFGTRTRDFTANFTGALSDEVKQARFRLNQSQWQVVRHEAPRSERPFFMVELPAGQLNPGPNTLTIEARRADRSSEANTFTFTYDPEPVMLPLTVDWQEGDWDVQDGYWEKVGRGEVIYLRPVPGYENYDRLIAVTSAFEGGRRVEVEAFFRHASNTKARYGFGILPLWGGRPDDPSYMPRRGWNFALAWYYSGYGGTGIEFSYKHGPHEPDWLSTYINYTVRPNTRYHIVTETWPEVDPLGRHLRYRQRMKFWAVDEQEPTSWIDLADSEGCPLRPGPYAIALVAHRCQVEFGPVRIEPLESVEADMPLSDAD